MVSEEDDTNYSDVKVSVPWFIKMHRHDILAGDFSFIENRTLDSTEKIYVDKLLEAYNTLGEEFISACNENKSMFTRTYELLGRYVSSYQKEAKRRESLYDLFKKIPEKRRKRTVKYYLLNFSDGGQTAEEVLSLAEGVESFHELVENTIIKGSKDAYYWVLDFLQWCTIDTDKLTEDFYETQPHNDKIRVIIKMRSEGKTLEEVGKTFDISRERIRQIESKGRRAFTNWEENKKILQLIAADLNGITIVDSETIQKYLNATDSEIIYLLKETSTYYDKMLDVFCIGELQKIIELKGFLSALPDVANETELRSLAIRFFNELGMSLELLLKLIKEQYVKYGTVYSKEKLSRGDMYSDILARYYPAGCRVYDGKETEQNKDNPA